jgi:hypothetical protein
MLILKHEKNIDFYDIIIVGVFTGRWFGERNRNQR